MKCVHSHTHKHICFLHFLFLPSHPLHPFSPLWHTPVYALYPEVCCWCSYFLNLFLIGGQLFYSVMLASATQQHNSGLSIHMSPLQKFPSTPYPIPLLQVVTEHNVELSVIYSNLPLAIHFTHGNVYDPMLLSQFIQPSPSLSLSISLFSMSASLSLPRKQVHQYHLYRFHIYVLICNIHFSFSDLFHAV